MRLDNDMNRTGGDRRPILIDFPPRQQGIAAALRRAFAAIDVLRPGCEFERLLTKIN